MHKTNPMEIGLGIFVFVVILIIVLIILAFIFETVLSFFEVLLGRPLRMSFILSPKKLDPHNIHEFFAVSVENIFEKPMEYIAELPQLYKLMSRMLNQDPLQKAKQLYHQV